MSWRLSDERGLTITELMVALMLLAAVSAVFLPLLESSMRITNDVGTVAQTNDEGRLALAQIDREFRAAERICDPDPGTSGNRLSFRTRAYTATTSAAGYQDLVYELRDPDGDGFSTHLQRTADGGATWRTVVGNVVNQHPAYLTPFPEVDQPVFETEGGAGSGSPSWGKVVTVRVWTDPDMDDRLSPRLVTTELAGRNVWTPSASGC